jgi:UDP-N-acetylmuramoylalanine--D-glutamate ligase
VGGNIGTPLFEYLEGPQDSDVAVIEVSSYQIDSGGGLNGLRPRVALLLNITPDHLDRYDSMAAYIASKFGIFAARPEGGAAILNTDDPVILAHRHLWPRTPLFGFGADLAGLHGALIRDHGVRLSGLDPLAAFGEPEHYDLTGTVLAAPPNLQNSAAAILAARLMGCPRQAIDRGLAAFTPLPHRMTVVAEEHGVIFIDDSKATNIGAVQAALEGIERPVVLIAGGRDKGGDYAMLAPLMRQKVKAMVLIGEAAEKMARAFDGLSRIETADNMAEAVRRAATLAGPGDVVLLSPACASFDMFENYARRGEAFSAAVRELTSNREGR